MAHGIIDSKGLNMASPTDRSAMPLQATESNGVFTVEIGVETLVTLLKAAGVQLLTTTAMRIPGIYNQLIRDEGIRLTVYTDTTGNQTIGIGHNLTANPLPFDVSGGLTMPEVIQLFNEDTTRIANQLFISQPWMLNLSYARRGVFINMAFNLGVEGLLTFTKTLAYAKAGDYTNCALEMTKSLWYTQVGARAQRLVLQMQTNIWY
jgi:lysozyme